MTREETKELALQRIEYALKDIPETNYEMFLMEKLEFASGIISAYNWIKVLTDEEYESYIEKAKNIYNKRYRQLNP